MERLENLLVLADELTGRMKKPIQKGRAKKNEQKQTEHQEETITVSRAENKEMLNESINEFGLLVWIE